MHKEERGKRQCNQKVSGVETDSAFIPANTPVYIGYVKDNSDYANGDYISFGVYATN